MLETTTWTKSIETQGTTSEVHPSSLELTNNMDGYINTGFLGISQGICPFHSTSTDPAYAISVLFKQATLRNYEPMIYNRALGASSALLQEGKNTDACYVLFMKAFCSIFEVVVSSFHKKKSAGPKLPYKTHNVVLNLLLGESSTQLCFGRNG